ncbi:MAG: hypothetical protein IJX57_04080, partial [Clostridia bacterium]|nr:hypothetical protein [Clostridia bacterium]
DGTCDSQLSPVKILDNVKEIFLSSYRYGTSGGTVSPYSAFAIKNDNTLWAWGGNQIGQLVDGTTEDRLAPVKVMDDVKKIDHRYDETVQWFALKTDDTLWGWGVNYSGTLGVGRDRVNFEEPVKIMNDVKNVFADNYDMTFAVKQDGSLWGWGVNYENSLGVNSDEEYVMSPTKIMDNVEVFTSTDAFNYGENLKYAIKTDGSFWRWGYENEDGENITNISTPQKISDNVVKCAVGVYGMNFFIKEDGTLWGWGYNDEGTLGDGTNVTRQNPVEIKAYEEIIEGDEYTINSINVLQQSVRASVTKNKDISAILILSSKSEDGTIIDVNYEYLSLSKGDTENVDLELNTKGADYVSGYIWSGIDKMQPVSKEIIKNIN